MDINCIRLKFKWTNFEWSGALTVAAAAVAIAVDRDLQGNSIVGNGIAMDIAAVVAGVKCAINQRG